MREHSKVRSVVAMLLAVAMAITQTGIVELSAAMETGPVSAEEFLNDSGNSGNEADAESSDIENRQGTGVNDSVPDSDSNSGGGGENGQVPGLSNTEDGEAGAEDGTGYLSYAESDLEGSQNQVGNTGFDDGEGNNAPEENEAYVEGNQEPGAGAEDNSESINGAVDEAGNTAENSQDFQGNEAEADDENGQAPVDEAAVSDEAGHGSATDDMPNDGSEQVTMPDDQSQGTAGQEPAVGGDFAENVGENSGEDGVSGEEDNSSSEENVNSEGAEGEPVAEPDSVSEDEAGTKRAEEPIALSMSIVSGPDNTPLDPSYTALDVPVSEENMDLTSSLYDGDVTTAMPVEGTNRLYLQSLNYEYAEINGEEAVSISLNAEEGFSFVTAAGESVALTEDTEILLHYSDAQQNRVYRYEDDQIEVEASVNDPAAIPDNAELVVTPILSGDVYDAYMSALNAQVEGEYDETNTLLYDIAFLAPKADSEGNPIEGEFVEIKPAGDSVSIRMNFKKKQLTDGLKAAEPEEIQIVHLPLDDALVGRK